MITSRRSFLAGLAATLVASPAIVRAASLMPVKVMPTEDQLQALLKLRIDEAYRITRESMVNVLFNDRLFYVVEDEPQTIQWSESWNEYEFKQLGMALEVKL